MFYTLTGNFTHFVPFSYVGQSCRTCSLNSSFKFNMYMIFEAISRRESDFFFLSIYAIRILLLHRNIIEIYATLFQKNGKFFAVLKYLAKESQTVSGVTKCLLHIHQSFKPILLTEKKIIKKLST